LDNRIVRLSQDYLYYVVGIGLFFVLIFSIRRGQKQPTKLNLRAGEPAPHAVPKKLGPGQKPTISPEAQDAQKLYPGEKTLNAVFTYNGHNFDAYEVLGLPAGARGVMVDDAYKREIAKASTQGRDFVECAYQTLKQKR